MKYVKIFVIFVLALMSIPMLGQQASAHPPGFMLLNYEEENLKVIVLHFTFARTAHRVYKIDVEVNGELVDDEGYEQQPRFWISIYEFTVTTEPGDEITVTAYCNLFGSKTKSITV